MNIWNLKVWKFGSLKISNLKVCYLKVLNLKGRIIDWELNHFFQNLCLFEGGHRPLVWGSSLMQYLKGQAFYLKYFFFYQICLFMIYSCSVSGEFGIYIFAVLALVLAQAKIYVKYGCPVTSSVCSSSSDLEREKSPTHG